MAVMTFKTLRLMSCCVLLSFIPCLGSAQDSQQTQEDLANLVAPPALFTLRIKEQLTNELVSVLRESLRQESVGAVRYLISRGKDGRPPQANEASYPLTSQDWAPSDIQRLLKEIRSISDEQARLMDSVASRKNAELRALIAKSLPDLVSESRYKHTGISILLQPEVAAWARRELAFQERSSSLYSLGLAYGTLFPDFQQRLIMAEAPEDKFAVPQEQRMPRMMLRAMLASPELRAQLGKDFDFDALQAEELALRKEAVRLLAPVRANVTNPNPLDDYFNWRFANAASSVMGSIRPEMNSFRETAQTRMKKLGQQAWRVSKPAFALACLSVEDKLDMASLQRSQKKWQSITDKSGQPVSMSIESMRVTGAAFIDGCGVKQDLATGIQIYEALVQDLGEPRRETVSPAGVLCTLARFYRNGVGVKQDSSKAAAYESLYATRYYPGNSCNPSGIDPRDRWNTLQ